LVIKQRRAFHRIDQADLARRAGTSQGQISRIERGAISPTFKTVERLLAAMGDELQLSVRRQNASTNELSGQALLYAARKPSLPDQRGCETE
jgi:transcriptional regulator with XRE-family HTH domain